MTQTAPIGPDRRLAPRTAAISPLLIIREAVDLTAGVMNLVIHPTGEVDLATSANLHQAVFSAIDRCKRVCLDLAEVTFFDILGLRTLSAASMHADHRYQAFWLRNPPELLRRVMVLSDMDQLNSDNPRQPNAPRTER